MDYDRYIFTRISPEARQKMRALLASLSGEDVALLRTINPNKEKSFQWYVTLVNEGTNFLERGGEEDLDAPKTKRVPEAQSA